MNDQIYTRRLLRLIAIYRVALTSLLLIASGLSLFPLFKQTSQEETYLVISMVYTLLAFTFLFVQYQEQEELSFQAAIQLSIDILFLGLLMHTSSGFQSNIQTFMATVVVAGAVLTDGRLSLFIASLASIIVLIEAVLIDIQSAQQMQYSDAGLYGVSFFAIAILTKILTRKIISSQQLAEKRQHDVDNLALLNSHIVNHMQVGVLVIEEDGAIEVINDSARQLLGLAVDSNNTARYISDIPQLATQFHAWKKNIYSPWQVLQIAPDLPEIVVTALLLDNQQAVLYLENITASQQQAQQLKLASLGQLVASIAHEVRNPLAAISHASELLQEQSQSKDSDKLTAIIQRHSQRVNTTIDTILELSRRKQAQPSAVDLIAWLNRLLAEFREVYQLTKQQVLIEKEITLPKSYVDVEQLHHIIWNLLDNAWHYSDQVAEKPVVKLRIAINHQEKILLDVMDNGPGVSPAMQKVLFEPFQSEREGGTGLGLYLAKEFSQANGIQLHYLSSQVQGSCFRLILPTEKRM
ncbi:MAG TPA: PAS domain-containing sensor histidine kinase [Gammaproteobacteria bacterium]|nr:PAS domain-containing sensor histidine kinase [Gammaproteobacteria bacterium]